MKALVLACTLVLTSVTACTTATSGYGVAEQPGTASNFSVNPPSPPVAGAPSTSAPESGAPADSAPAVTAPSGVATNNAPPDGAVGSLSGGDPYYPNSGNGGYDVASYDVAVVYTPETGELLGTVGITATVNQGVRLGRMGFDLQNTMTVSQVAINGKNASFSQANSKLIITPASGLDEGASFVAVITYSGVPGPIGGGTAGLGDGGWYTLASGGAVAIGEPYSASAWFPANEIPYDEATFRVTATVPEKWKVISNGLPTQDSLPPTPAGSAVFQWTETAAMSTYLTTLYIDTFTTTQGVTASGIPIINAYATSATSSQALGDKTASYVSFLESIYGPYPFDSVGGIFIGENIGFALETQTRPVYPQWVDEATVVHELAHQWFGDAVTLTNWSDVCLNECFASYSQWQWQEAQGYENLDKLYLQQVATAKSQPSFWELPLVDMGSGNEFGDVYTRGPLALHALRAEMGAEAFSTLLKDWVKAYSGKTASWTDFEAMANKLAGRDLSAFLKAWFRDTGVPADQYLYPGNLKP
ncbi:M1 family metallopeptidase [Nakamurella antarctica]|uniref:M1 family metallopeptidase n=1 Tax=Nakamurella antarctica TaxID=1902245 RepID=UPI0013DE4C57|nr:M1 family metallopeptidase [Nakamurella antarctica]